MDDPTSTTWQFPPPETADEWGLLGVGADLEPTTILHAYRQGIFPMPVEDDGAIGWWSPDPRGVLDPDRFHASRSLRRSVQRYEIRLDAAFPDVIRACADPQRSHGWIDERVVAAYTRLHALGHVHSVEAWDEDGLAGGLYGVAIGGLFAAESMFHRRTDAGKVALSALVGMLEPEPAALLDVQWLTPHLERLGATEIARTAYLGCLQNALRAPPPAALSSRNLDKE